MFWLYVNTKTSQLYNLYHIINILSFIVNISPHLLNWQFFRVVSNLIFLYYLLFTFHHTRFSSLVFNFLFILFPFSHIFPHYISMKLYFWCNLLNSLLYLFTCLYKYLISSLIHICLPNYLINFFIWKCPFILLLIRYDLPNKIFEFFLFQYKLSFRYERKLLD